MKRTLLLALVGGGTALAAWQGALAIQNEAAEGKASAPKPPAKAAPKTGAGDKAAAKAAPEAKAQAAPITGETPMNQRIATLGLLNKRNGLSRDLRMRPGQAVRVGDVIVRLRACEATAPWEPEKLTGAFVQTDVRGRDARWRRVFSGWLFKESPSLNVVEHPVYDVWPKSCEMRHPEVGPATVPVGAGAPSSSGNRSRAKKSTASPPPAPNRPSASSSSDT